MNEPRPTFTQRKRSHQRMLHVMTKHSQKDIVQLEDGTNVVYLDEAYTAADTALLLAETVRLARIGDVSRHILTNDVTAAVLDGRLSGQKIQDVRKLQQFLKIAVRVNTEDFKTYFPEHQFHPGILLGLEAIEEIKLSAEYLPNNEQSLALLRAILRLGMTTKYVELRSHYRKAAGKRLRATKDYINAIFQQCKRQLVVRVDLGYKNIPSPDGQGTARSSVSFAKVGRHRERLEKAMGRAWGSSLSGFVMRLEWAPHKAFHCHLLVLLKGHKVQGRTFNAMKIGEMWAKATHGLGDHWEPTAHEGDTRGTGKIDGNKPEELAAVIKTAAYLCKEGHYIDYYKGEKEKTFFRGDLD